jgi:hypothetical protein
MAGAYAEFEVTETEDGPWQERRVSLGLKTIGIANRGFVVLT